MCNSLHREDSLSNKELVTLIKLLFTTFLKKQARIIFLIFGDFLMFYIIFFSPQVKRCAIITLNMVYRSCLTSFRTTEDFQKSPKTP